MLFSEKPVWGEAFELFYYQAGLGTVLLIQKLQFTFVKIKLYPQAIKTPFYSCEGKGWVQSTNEQTTLVLKGLFFFFFLSLTVKKPSLVSLICHPHAGSQTIH